MSTINKGYFSNQTEANFKYVTVEPTRQGQVGFTVNAHQFCRSVGNDAAEANSTTTVITATAHVALVGDIINFTSGTLSGLEFKVSAVAANTITVVQTMTSAPGVGDTFEILRYKTPTVTSTGAVQVDAAFTEAATAADGAAAPALGKMVAGLDSGGNTQYISVDTNGELQVDVLNLGKTESAAHVSGDVGVQSLAVRNDAGAALAADGQYIPLTTDSTGALRTASQEQAVAADGAAAPAVSKVVAGVDGVGNTQTFLTDTSGQLNVNSVSEVATSANAAVGLPALSKVVAGYDGTNVRTVSTDNTGRVNVNTGFTESALAADGAVGLPALTKVIAGYDGANIQAIHTDANGDVQVDLVGSLPAGNNNVGDVDIASFPGGLTGYAEDSAHVSGDIGLMALAVRQDATGPLAADGDYTPLQTNANGELKVTTATEVATVADGGALPALTKVISGYDGANVQVIHTDAAGDLQVDLASALPAGTNAIGSVIIGSDIIPFAHDYISINYATATQEIYTYKTGGSGGATVATLTINYTDATKDNVSDVTRT